MIEYLDQIDQQLMLFLNYDGGAWVDAFWFSFSAKFVWVGMYFLILVKFYFSCRRLEKPWLALLWLVICTALLITLCDQISSGIIKHWVERPRPSHNPLIESSLHFVNNYKAGRYGFVSSHAANSIGLVIWLCLLFRNKLFLGIMLAWSIATCYSRIYLGVHYPGDILGGLCVGIACAFLIHYLYRKLIPTTQQIPAEKHLPWQILAALFITVISIAVTA